MERLIGMATLATATVLLVACSHKEAEQAPAPAPAVVAGPTVIEIMTATMTPRSDAIWKVAGDLYDDKGNLDAKKLSDQQWTDMNLAAVAMAASAKTLGETAGIKVVAPGGKIQSEGTPDGATAAQVQALIDADPPGFAAFSTQLVTVAEEIAAATAARDAKKTDDAQNRLNDVYMACHVKFWYPAQPK